MSLSHIEELWKLARLGQLDKAELTPKARLATALFPEATEQLHRYFSYKAVPGIINPFPLSRPQSERLLLGFQSDALDSGDRSRRLVGDLDISWLPQGYFGNRNGGTLVVLFLRSCCRFRYNTHFSLSVC